MKCFSNLKSMCKHVSETILNLELGILNMSEMSQCISDSPLPLLSFSTTTTAIVIVNLNFYYDIQLIIRCFSIHI